MPLKRVYIYMYSCTHTWNTIIYSHILMVSDSGFHPPHFHNPISCSRSPHHRCRTTRWERRQVLIAPRTHPDRLPRCCPSRCSHRSSCFSTRPPDSAVRLASRGLARPSSHRAARLSSRRASARRPRRHDGGWRRRRCCCSSCQGR